MERVSFATETIARSLAGFPARTHVYGKPNFCGALILQNGPRLLLGMFALAVAWLSGPSFAAAPSPVEDSESQPAMVTVLVLGSYSTLERAERARQSIALAHPDLLADADARQRSAGSLGHGDGSGDGSGNNAVIAGSLLSVSPARLSAKPVFRVVLPISTPISATDLSERKQQWREAGFADVWRSSVATTWLGSAISASTPQREDAVQAKPASVPSSSSSNASATTFSSTALANEEIENGATTPAVSAFVGGIPGLTPERAWDAQGYVKYLGTYQPDSAQGPDHLIHHRVNFEYRFNSELQFNAGLRNRFFAGASAALPGFADVMAVDDGYWNLSSVWHERSRRAGVSALDRLYLKGERGQWQARLGRMRVNWGMNTIFNPVDYFNAYSVYDFDYEERPGSDGIEFTRQLGFASQVDVVYSPHQSADQARYAVRYLNNARGWDWQAILGKSGLDQVVGAAFAGDVKGAGFRAEFSWFEPTTDFFLGQPRDATGVVSIEADYSFASRRNWMLRGAVLYVGKPELSGSSASFLAQPLTARSLSFSRWTGYADVGFEPTDLSRLTLSTLYYEDGSVSATLLGTYSLADNWELSGVLRYYGGSDSSLFGSAPQTLGFARLRWSY